MAPGMKWDAEADAKLFGLFLNIFDIKVSGDMMKKLNAAMGFDPKSQAIAHRIGSVRKRAADLLSDSDGNPIKPAPLTPRGPKSVGTPGTRGSNRKGAATKHDSEDSGDSGVGLLSAPPSSAKRPRSARKAAGAKRSYKEPDTSEDEGDEKKLSDEEERAAASKKIKLEKEDEIKDGDGEEAGVEEAQKSFFDGDGGLDQEEV